MWLTVELSRVHIPMKAGVEGSDYINASFLQVHFGTVCTLRDL